MTVIGDLTGEVSKANLMALYIGGLYEYTDGATWDNSPEIAKELRSFISTGYTVFSELRSAFDQVVWDAHDSGKLAKEGDNSVPGIRNRSEYTNGKPGRKAKTLAEKLAEKIR